MGLWLMRRTASITTPNLIDTSLWQHWGPAAPGPSGHVRNAAAGRSGKGSPQDRCGCRELVQDHRVSPQTSGLSLLLSLFLALDMPETHVCGPSPPSVMFIILYSGLTSLLIHL